MFATLTLLAMALSGCFAQPAASPPPTPAASSSTPTPTEAANGPWEKPRDGSEVTVQETGVTATRDSGGDPMASWAVTVQNPSADIAVRTVLRITLLDADGQPVATKGEGEKNELHVVNLVMPGEQQTITHASWYRGEVAEIEAEVVSDAWRSSWFPGDDERFVPVEATDVEVGEDGSGDAVVTYQVNWPYEHHFGDDGGNVPTYAAFRDQAGNLVGGTHHTEADPWLYRPGDNSGSIDIRHAPDDWDSVEVYVDPWVDVDRLED